MNENDPPPMRRGISLAYAVEHLGEPAKRETFRTEHMCATMAIWPHGGSPVTACHGTKIVPPSQEDIPEDDWWIRPCWAHEHLFIEFPIVTVGTPAWGEQA